MSVMHLLFDTLLTGDFMNATNAAVSASASAMRNSPLSAGAHVRVRHGSNRSEIALVSSHGANRPATVSPEEALRQAILRTG